MQALAASQQQAEQQARDAQMMRQQQMALIEQQKQQKIVGEYIQPYFCYCFITIMSLCILWTKEFWIAGSRGVKERRFHAHPDGQFPEGSFFFLWVQIWGLQKSCSKAAGLYLQLWGHQIHVDALV